MTVGRADLVPFLKYGTIGVVNTVLHSAVVLIGHGRLGVPVVLTHLVGFMLANIFSYFLNSRLVFHRPPAFRSYLRFLAVSLFALISTLVVASVCEFLEIDYRIGLVAVIVIAPPITYLLQKQFTFRAS